jgi:hypothetical protein
MRIELPIESIRRCSADAEFVAAVAALFGRLDEDIAARGPVCTNRGACCKFGRFGHNLFVTSVELAYFLATSDGPVLAPPDRAFCPYQIEGVCAARRGRPAGCRIFFCDPTAQEWQPDLTEGVLRELAAIGERFGLDYAYLEWTDALWQLGGEIVGDRSASGPSGHVETGLLKPAPEKGSSTN